MKQAAAILIFLILGSMLVGARQQETLEQLMARADAARPEQQPDLCTQVAERELKLAVEVFKANKLEEGRAAVQELVKYSDKAHSASIHSGKRIKHTEIKIRQFATRLRDVKLDVGADDQSTIQEAIDRLETFRTELLRSMFGAKSHDD